MKEEHLCPNCLDHMERCENCGYLDCPTCGDWIMDQEGLWFCPDCAKELRKIPKDEHFV